MKRFGILTSILMMVVSISACGSATNNLGGTMDGYGTYGGYDSGVGIYDYDAYGYDNTYGYNMYDTYGYDAYGYNAYGEYGGDMNRGYADGGAAYWDGYGINEGRTLTSDTGYDKYTTKSLLN